MMGTGLEGTIGFTASKILSTLALKSQLKVYSVRPEEAKFLYCIKTGRKALVEQ